MRLPWARAARLGPVLDFVAGPARPPATAWCLLAGGVLVSGAASLDFWAARQGLDTQTTQLLQLQAQAAKQTATQRLASATGPADAKTSTLAADRAADGAAREAAWVVARRLQHPWPRVFDSIDALAPAGVRWLALEHDSGRAELRLEGAARSSAAALALVDLLARQPLLQSVVMTRLDPADPSLPPPAVRFEMSARLALLDATRAAAPAAPLLAKQP